MMWAHARERTPREAHMGGVPRPGGPAAGITPVIRCLRGFVNIDENL